MAADAPGSGMTCKPASNTASTICAPGSDIPGVPASETNAMRAPSLSCCTIFSATLRSLC